MAKKPSTSLYPNCLEGTHPMTRRKSKNLPKTVTVGMCKKDEWLSDAKCADRTDKDITVSGDPEMDRRINESINKAPDLCYTVIGKDPGTGQKLYKTDKKGKPVVEPSGLYFCRQNKGILRKDMPQMEGFDDQIGAIQDVNKRGTKPRLFLDLLISEGVKVRDEYVEVCKLKATQKELEGDKVRVKIETLKELEGKLDRFKVEELAPMKARYSKMNKNELLAEHMRLRTTKPPILMKDVIDPTMDEVSIRQKLLETLYRQYFDYLLEMVTPIIVSKEGYIVDGHHRWAALLAWDFKDKLDKPIKIHVKVIGLPIEMIITRAHDFNKQYYANLKK
jgi:hypothetical protein